VNIKSLRMTGVFKSENTNLEGGKGGVLGRRSYQKIRSALEEIPRSRGLFPFGVGRNSILQGKRALRRAYLNALRQKKKKEPSHHPKKGFLFSGERNILEKEGEMWARIMIFARKTATLEGERRRALSINKRGDASGLS